jgi:hypothetical protein
MLSDALRLCPKALGFGMADHAVVMVWLGVVQCADHTDGRAVGMQAAVAVRQSAPAPAAMLCPARIRCGLPWQLHQAL